MCLIVAVTLDLWLATLFSGVVIGQSQSPNPSGGPSVFQGEINGPLYITVDSQQNIYIYERATKFRGLLPPHHVPGVIRRIRPSGDIETLAIECSPEESSVRDAGCIHGLLLGMVIDTSSNRLLLAEFENRMVRALDPATYQFSVVAGNGDAQTTGDGGLAAKAGSLPFGIDVDDSGNVFIAESSGYIRRVDGKTGRISTVAGNGRLGLSGDGGPPLAAQVGLPLGVVVDHSGNLYITADQSDRIRRVNANHDLIEPIGNVEDITKECYADSKTGASNHTYPSYPLNSLAVDPMNDIFFITSARICQISAASGSVSIVAGTGEPGYSGDGGLAKQARISPTALAVDSHGDLFFAEYDNNRIRRIDMRTGIIATVAGNGLPTRQPSVVP